MTVKTVTVHVPLDADEVARRDAEVAARNEERHRKNVAEQNRKRGLAEPTVGSKLFVATAHAIKVRGRAGLVFSPTPSEVEVIDGTDEEIRAKQIAGASITNVWGAEQILADANAPHLGLIVFNSKADANTALTSASDAELEAELAARKARAREGSPERITSAAKRERTAGSKTEEPKG